MQRKTVLASIRRLHNNRHALNIAAAKREQPELVEAVYAATPYWGWKQALSDAGLSYETIRIEVRETIKCHLCGKAFQALSTHLRVIHEIDCEDYREQYPGAELVSESIREAMSGPTVNLHPDRIPDWEPFWTPEYVLDRVNEYAIQGYWMELSAIAEIDTALVGAAREILGLTIWDDVLLRIGMDPVVYRGCYRPNDFKLADLQSFLEERRAAGISCTKAELFATYDDHHRRPRVMIWAVQRYGNWSAALDAAGVDRSDPLFGGDRYLTAESVTKDLRRLRRELSDMSHTTVSLLPYGVQLTGAATRYFGSWDAALDAARIPRSIRRRDVSYDNAEAVTAAIAQRFEHGFGLAPLDVFYGTRSNIQLWKAAFDFFASWRAAVAHAGGSSSQIKQASQTPLGSRPKVLKELRKRGEDDVTRLSVTSLTSEEGDKHLYVMAVGFFGGWQTAVREIGIDPKSYHQWNLEPPRKYVDEKAVLKEIRKRRREQRPLHARGLTGGDDVDAPLLYTARKLFGDWESAVRAAGIEYDKIVRKRQDYEALRDRTYRIYSSVEEVTAELRRRQAAGLPLNSRALTHGSESEHRDFALHKTAVKLFKTWERALTRAGIDVESVRPAWVTERAKRNRKK